MIIFGTTGITSVQSKGSFCCPACGSGAGYQHKGVTRFFTLFFIPLIPMGKVADFILCDRCGGNFKPEVLTWGGRVPSSPGGGPPALPGSMPPPIFEPLQGNFPGSAFQNVSAFTITHRSNGLATASMILGIIGLLSSFLFCPSVFLCITGLILGLVGLSRVRKEQSLFDGKGKAIAGIACSSVGLAIMLVFVILAAKDGNRKPDSKSPRQVAASSIRSSSSQTAFGNTPKAVELAKIYATMMSGMHQEAFISSKGKAPKSAKYIVHCELREDTCAFLAFVPDYRKLTGDAKTSLEEIAWSAARSVVNAEPTMKPEMELCVALKGLVMFGSVMTGPVKADSPTTNSKDEEDMDRFFPTIENENPTVEKVQEEPIGED